MSYSTWENCCCGLRHQTAEMPKRAIVKRTLMTHDGMSHHRLKLPPLPSLVDHIPAFLWHWCVRAPCLKWPQHIIKAGFHVMAFAKVAASFVERVPASFVPFVTYSTHMIHVVHSWDTSFLNIWIIVSFSPHWLLTTVYIGLNIDFILYLLWNYKYPIV